MLNYMYEVDFVNEQYKNERKLNVICHWNAYGVVIQSKKVLRSRNV